MLSSSIKQRAAEEDHRWATKSILRIFGGLCALLATTLFAASIRYTNANFDNASGPGQWADGVALAPAVLALIFNPLDLALHFALRKGRPLHPAFHVGLDLIIWAMLIPGIIIALGGGSFWYWTDGEASADGTIDCAFFFNAFARECSPIVYQIGRMEIAGLVFEFLLFVVHLSMFIFAIVDLHRRRAAQNALDASSFDMEMRKDLEQRSFSQRS